MSKKFFRFLRGELNGFYLQSLNSAMNTLVRDVESFFCYFKRMVFKSEMLAGKGERAVTHDILQGIGIFAGVFPPWVSQDALPGSLRFTSSHLAGSQEVSDQGLYQTDDGTFQFPSTFNISLYESEGAGRNAYAASSLKSTLVEKGARPLGYFQEGDKVIDDEGNLSTALMITPPADYTGDWNEWAEAYFKAREKAYYPYYGAKYLYFAEKSPVVLDTGDDLYVELVRAMQYVRHNGASVSSLCEFGNILCPNFLFITSMDWTSSKGCCTIGYGFDEMYELPDKLPRTEIFKLLAGQKFKQFDFHEESIVVERDADGNVTYLEVKR